MQASSAVMIARHQNEIGSQDDVESQALRALLASCGTIECTRGPFARGAQCG
jgi:hypothetical protein